ncbi:serine/threonine-protein kinase [Nocardia inohanensis]|uniref:serine/threonine-protein kinase n=1 Tax=Nocardia inohanensis TaxID=209246 RepID=UPI000A0230E3|nr:serine/threonine-protein kinase [Nocardia inohanensis]
MARRQAPERADQGVLSARAGLAVAVARYAEAWETGIEPPDPAAFLPETAELRTAVLIELIKVDLQHRWRRTGEVKRLSAYVTEFPELQEISLPPDLLYEEYYCLLHSGVTVDAAQYEESIRIDLATGHYRSTLISQPRAFGELEQLAAGEHVDDFELLLMLGSGAFARVFLARQRSMERLVALKISHNHGVEPQILAQLDHPHIVRVYDMRLLADRDLKLMYMEYVAGGTLLDVLRQCSDTPPERRDGRTLLAAIDEVLGEKGVHPADTGVRAELAALSWPETVAWLGRGLADALDYSARHGILHRDIKPANVLLTAEGVPKLADFNVGFSNHIAGVSPIAYFGGSLAYMSPEQLAACHPHLPEQAEELDQRSDIYALGVLLWELLTGHRPFADEITAGDTANSLDGMLRRRHQGLDAEAFAELPPDCPATLRRILRTCLAPHREDRWASSAELVQQFELCLDPRARDLVDPPPGSARERLALLPIASAAIVAGQLLAVLYLYAHNQTLLNAHMTGEQQRVYMPFAFAAGSILQAVFTTLILYFARDVIIVPRGMRRGIRYDPARVNRTRALTLRCGDQIAMLVVIGWALALLPMGGAVLVLGELPPLLLADIFASHLVSGLVAAIFPYFLVTFHVVRWYYPGLLLYGTSRDSDAEQLAALSRRATRKLLAAALIPPLAAVAGAIFLNQEDLHRVIGAVLALTAIGAIVFAASFGLYRILQADLAALRWTMISAGPNGRVPRGVRAAWLPGE